MEKQILDACCGGRMFWFDKKHPLALYMDIRKEPRGLCKERPNFHIAPDLLADFRNLPFRSNSFNLIVWDPPHLKKGGANCILVKKYGLLGVNWEKDLAQGFNELWRVLLPAGTLIFKWNEDQIILKDVLACFSQKPIFGHPTGKIGKTMWCVFYKPAPCPPPAPDFPAKGLKGDTFIGKWGYRERNKQEKGAFHRAHLFERSRFYDGCEKCRETRLSEGRATD